MKLVISGQNFSISNNTMEFLMRNKDGNMNNYYGYSLDEHLQNGEPSCTLPMSSLFFHNISKGRTRGEVPFMIPGNIRKKFENFTRYINSKDHNLLRETFDNLNEMSSDYSDFINSSRGYSYVSNSIASYIIGGFVGSKSQMNNEKHKLSYDLGGAIFKILKDCKCDRQYDKLKDDKKFEVSKFGKRSKFKDPNGFIQDIVLSKNLINSGDIETKPNLESIDCLNKIRISAFGSIKMDEVGVNCGVVVKEEENCDIETTQTTKERSSEEINQGSGNNIRLETSMVDNEERATCSVGYPSEDQSAYGSHYRDGLQFEFDKGYYASDSNTSSVEISPLEERKRRISQGSNDSSDTDSFIVFDDNCFFEPPASLLPDHSPAYYEEDSSFESDDEDECEFSRIRTIYEWNINDENREVTEANARWQEAYGDAVDRSTRRVRFKEEVIIHRMVTWDYAYRSARVGPWEQMAHDRERFKDRILRLSFVISPILKEDHRQSVYEKLYG